MPGPSNLPLEDAIASLERLDQQFDTRVPLLESLHSAVGDNCQNLLALQNALETAIESDKTYRLSLSRLRRALEGLR